MSPGHVSPLALAGTTLVGGGVAVAQAADSPGSSIAFSATEIAVVTAMLGAVIAGLALVFRLLLDSKDTTMTALRAQNAALTEQLQQQYREPALLLTGAIRTNEAAVNRVADVMQRCTERLGELSDVGTAEHAQMLQALQAVAALLRPPGPVARRRAPGGQRAPAAQKGSAA